MPQSDRTTARNPAPKRKPKAKDAPSLAALGQALLDEHVTHAIAEAIWLRTPGSDRDYTVRAADNERSLASFRKARSAYLKARGVRS